MGTIIIAIVTSLVVSFIWSKWFMKQQEKWLDEFFDEETERIKKILSKDK